MVLIEDFPHWVRLPNSGDAPVGWSCCAGGGTHDRTVRTIRPIGPTNIPIIRKDSRAASTVEASQRPWSRRVSVRGRGESAPTARPHTSLGWSEAQPQVSDRQTPRGLKARCHRTGRILTPLPIVAYAPGLRDLSICCVSGFPVSMGTLSASADILSDPDFNRGCGGMPPPLPEPASAGLLGRGFSRSERPRRQGLKAPRREAC